MLKVIIQKFTCIPISINFLKLDFFFRAWNSLKFDLPSAEEECLLAESVANRAKLKVKSNALLLTQYSNEVLLQKQLGGRSFRERQYPCAHPLTRNW